jgi:molecular chaperone HscB
VKVIDDYFAVFGLPRKLTVDGEALRARFYELSRAHHPDFHQGADADAQAETLTRSALVNRAYRALRDPLARVEYLIALEEGRDTREGAIARPAAPRELLAEMMEVQEALEEAKAAGMDDASRARLREERSVCRRGSARRKTPSWAGRGSGMPRSARRPTAVRCSSGSRPGWPRGHSCAPSSTT